MNPHEDELFGTLRSLLQQRADVTVFADVCAAIDELEAQDPGAFAARYLDYTRRQLAHWPWRARTVSCSFSVLEDIEKAPWAPLITSLKVGSYGAPDIPEIRDHLDAFPNLAHLTFSNFGMRQKPMLEAIDSGLLDGLETVGFDRTVLNNYATFTGILERIADRQGTQDVSTLSFRDCQLKSSHLSAICDAPFASRLRDIDVSENSNMKTAAAKVLAEAAPKLKALERLAMSGCNLTSAATKALAQAKWATPLTHLDLGHNALKGNALKPLDEAGMLPALVDRSGAPSLDISSFDLDDAALTRLASRGLFDDLHRFTFSHSKTKASSLEPLLDHEDALEGVRHLSIFGWDVSERDVNRLARRGALVSIRRSGKAMKGDLTDDEVRAADLETAALLSDHPDLRHVYFGYSGNLGEATLEVLLGGEGPGRFDQADVVMRVPTDSPLLAIARDTDGFVFSDVDDHVKVSLHLLANHGARPLLMDGTYRRD